jgi:hypothetical protein
MQMGDAKVLAPTRSFWVGALYPAETKEKTGKDMVMTCRAVAVVAGQAAAATADAGPDNAPRDPAPDVTPSGRPGCKNAAVMLRDAHRKVRSNQAERRAVRQNLQAQTLRAGPRAVRQRQLTLYPAHDNAADTVGSAAAAVLDPVHWPDIAGSPASVASAAPPAGMLHCKSDSADAAANTAVHIP